MKNNIYANAEQWFPGKKITGVYRTFVDNITLKFDHAWIDLYGFRHKVKSGDWIITLQNSDRAVYSKEDFERIFEKIE